jgi:integrase
MASISSYLLADGSKRYRVHYRDPSHTSKEKSGFKRKHDAEDWMARNVTAAINDGAYVDPAKGRVTIGLLGKEWLRAKKAIWKPSTYRPVESAWNNHVKGNWEDIQLVTVNRSQVQNWVSKLSETCGATLVLRCFGILKGIFETAIDDGRIKGNPCERIDLPKKHRKKHVYLTPQQLIDLSQESGSHKNLIITLGFCGLRWGEAAALTVNSVDFKKNRLHIVENTVRVGSERITGTPKNGQYRDVPMPEYVATALKEQCKGKTSDDLVFTDDDGAIIRYQSISNKGGRGWYKNALKAAASKGVPMLTCHDLRHTAASIAVSAGANVLAVKRMLGHSSAAMTLDVYSDLFDTDLDSVAVNIDGLIHGLSD